MRISFRPRPLNFLATFLAGAVLLAAAVVLILNPLLDRPDLAIEWKVGTLAAAALVFLLASLAALYVAIGRSTRPGRQLFFLAEGLALAYIVPALAFYLPGALPALAGNRPGVSQPLVENPRLAFLFWHTIVLGLWAAAAWLRAPQIEKARLPRLTAWQILSGLLGGWGLWLAGSFLTGLMGASRFDAAPFGLPALVAAGLLAPYVQERAFRGSLSGQLSPSAHPLLLTSLIFGLLQFETLAILPGLVFGAGALLLTRRSASLWPAILAHSFFNLLTIVIGWGVVL